MHGSSPMRLKDVEYIRRSRRVAPPPARSKAIYKDGESQRSSQLLHQTELSPPTKKKESEHRLSGRAWVKSLGWETLKEATRQLNVGVDRVFACVIHRRRHSWKPAESWLSRGSCRTQVPRRLRARRGRLSMGARRGRQLLGRASREGARGKIDEVPLQ